MGSLTRRPVTQDAFTQTANTTKRIKKEVEKVERKKDYNASVRIATETRTQLNALRKVTKHKNIDDLLQEMINQRVKKLKDHDKMKYELLIEE